MLCCSNQDVFYKISQIMWKEGDKHTEIVDIMGGFHIILVILKFFIRNMVCCV